MITQQTLDFLKEHNTRKKAVSYGLESQVNV